MSAEKYEEWLARLDIPIEDTTTIGKFQDYLRSQLQFSDNQIDALSELYPEHYDFLPTVEIQPFTITRTYEGIKYEETRYAIKGYAGAWGYERMLEIAEEKAEAIGAYDIASWFRTRRGEL